MRKKKAWSNRGKWKYHKRKGKDMFQNGRMSVSPCPIISLFATKSENF